jgi:hypothetical protein
MGVMTATLRVHRRAYTPVSQPQDEVVAAARTLDTNGRVDDCAFSEWPATVALDHDCEAVDVYDAVTDWAEDADVDVSTPFRVHTRTNPVTGQAQAVLHTPVVYLTLERDGEIDAAAPCTLPDGTHLTAKDFLDALQSRENPLGEGRTDAPVA